jgi:hypothetical protein
MPEHVPSLIANTLRSLFFERDPRSGTGQSDITVQS